MAPWPRRIFNYPIILLATVYQHIAAFSLAWDHAAGSETAIHALVLVFLPAVIVPFVILAAATMAWAGFLSRWKSVTVLCLAPQQLLLYIGAGGACYAIWNSQFADGVIRPQAFLLIDQCLIILLAVFHSWAMVLIQLYAIDRE